MGLLGDDVILTNAIPNQDKPWTNETATQLWEMFVDGGSFKQIGKAVGKNEKAVRRQIENQIDHWHRHPNTVYPRNRSTIAWTQRDAWVLNRALQQGVDIETIAKLLGRTFEQIQKRAIQKA